ncbi:MAG: energy transducer TonB [Oligoflexales bacterium]
MLRFAIIASICVHFFFGVWLSLAEKSPDKSGPAKVKIKIVEVPPEAAKPPKPVPPKPKPEKPKKVATERKKAPNKPVTQQPVQGLSPDAVSDDGKIAAPVGNTLMTEDEGKRLKPEDVKPLDADLSRDPILIASSIKKPEYTDQALSTGFEGLVVVSVFVNDTGDVSDAEIDKEVGYGMDERIIQSARQAKFQPRLDKNGNPVSGWAEIKFSMRIE